MRARQLWGALVLVVSLVAAPGVWMGRATAGPASRAGGAPELLVKFAEGTEGAERARALAAHGLSRRQEKVHDEQLGRIGWTAVTTSGVDAGRARRGLTREPGVVAVEKNERRRALAEPTDPHYRKGRQRYLETVRFPEAWGRRDAAVTPVIAVVDSGVDRDHPDLRDRLLAGYDFVNGDADASDDHGHGTSVAGVAAAVPDNGIGVTGAAWGASILPVKVLDADGEGSDADVAAGMVWAADRGASVINLSLGGVADSAALRDAVAYANSKGAVVVAAAGNGRAGTAVFPAAIPAVVAVTATDWSGNVASISGYGAWVDIAAPGLDIAATTMSSRPSETYGSVSGTSFASALVAAAASLVRGTDAGLSAAGVASRLTSTARDAGPPGVDPFYGAGVLDAGAALGSAPLVAAAPPGDDNDGPDRAPLIAVAAPAPGVQATGTITGTISPEGDVDWFAFEVPDPGFYGITVTPPEALLYGGGRRGWAQERAEALDSAIEIFGPDLRKLLEHDQTGTATQEYVRLSVLTSGRHYIRIANKLPTRSPGDYTIRVDRGTSPPQRFTEYQPYDLGSPGESVAIGDVTGDGRADALLTTGSYDDPDSALRLWVFAQRSDGWFDPPVSFPTGWGTQLGVATGDLDGDGKLDAAVANETGVLAFYQRSGQLTPGTRILGAADARQVEIVDLDGDGRQELLVATGTDLLLGRRSGAGWSTTRLGDATVDIEVGDVTGDSRLDIVAAAGTQLRVHPQRADGTFAAPTSYLAGVEGANDHATALAVGDLTGDGRADVAASTPFCWRPCLHIHPQTSAGTLGPPRSHQTLEGLEPIEAADVNRDGRMDLVGAHGGWDNVGVFLQTASGELTFDEYHDVPQSSHYRSSGLAVGDITGDGAPDVITANYTSGLVVQRQLTAAWPALHPAWLRHSTPADGSTAAATSVAPAVRFGRMLDPASVSTATVSLLDGRTGVAVASGVSYNAATSTVTIQPQQPLASANPYRIVVSGTRDSRGELLRDPITVRFRTTAPADTAPPDTRIVAGPSGRVRLGGAYSFAVTASEPGTRFECRLHTVEFYPCSPPFKADQNYAGTFRFSVRAVDAAGNIDPTPAEQSWTTADASWPANDDTQDAQVISGSQGSVTGTNFRGTLQGGEPFHGGNPGGASVWYSWIAPGTGLFTFDTAGSAVDTLVGAYTWSPDPRALDPLLPVEGNDDPPGGTHARITFHATAGTEYMIAVDSFFDEYFQPGGDIALRWASAPITDTVAPDTTITNAPSATTTATTARFEFISSEPASTFTCALDGAAPAPCVSPYKVAGLSPGSHRFSVRATDASANSDPTPAVHTWTVSSGSTTTST
ncbi:MAG: S8 family serine peptidase, partial [Actinobacteria bacterium]|nr:S8 family serine peptidase [Actinomycetota bacterium]